MTASEPACLNAICSRSTCFLCGGSRHNCQQCPAKNAIRHSCEKPTYFVKVCQSKCKQLTTKTTVSTLALILAILKSLQSLQKTRVSAYVNNQSMNVLIDTGSSDSFICKKSTQASYFRNRLCVSSVTTKLLGQVTVDI